jgi:hypothetical protein
LNEASDTFKGGFMKIAIINDRHDSRRESIYYELKELSIALEGLGHLIVHLDFSNVFFVSDLVYSEVDVAYIPSGFNSVKWKKVLQVLQALQIPLLHEEYCFTHLFELLNPEAISYRQVQNNQYVYRSEHHHLINMGGN